MSYLVLFLIVFSFSSWGMGNYVEEPICHNQQIKVLSSEFIKLTATIFPSKSCLIEAKKQMERT